MCNLFGVGRGPQIHKNGLPMVLTIRGDAAKSGKNTNLLVINVREAIEESRSRNLTNRTRFEKRQQLGNNVRKVFASTAEFVL